MSRLSRVKRFIPAEWRRSIRRRVDSVHCRDVIGKISLGDGKVDVWTVCAAELNKDSIVYSGGVGRAISFELSLVRLFGCKIELFDPTPTATATMANPENQHPAIRFHPVGLGGESGVAKFACPRNEAEGSFYVTDGAPDSEALAFRIEDLHSIMRRLGHDHIDLLKIDIEGSEIGVLQQICSRGLPVKQICVEFHPQNTGRSSIRKTKKLLKRRGFALVHKTRMDHTYLAGA